MRKLWLFIPLVLLAGLWLYGCDKPVPAEPDTDQQALFAKKCPTGTTACKGKCVDLSTDANNCGACGAKCAAGEPCVNGTCSAPTCSCEDVGMTTCGSSCADLDNDPDNCGSCAFGCAGYYNIATGYCLGGLCGVASCNPNYGDCNDEGADGCEAYLPDDVENCGLCGLQCPQPPNSTEFCDQGFCGYNCNSGYLECDGNPTNGCEVIGQICP